MSFFAFLIFEIKPIQMNMTHEDFIKLVEDFPTVTVHGFGIEIEYDDNRPYQEIWEEKRKMLLNAYREFTFCCQWIYENFDLVVGSYAYHLKHQVERWAHERKLKPDYIPEGVLTLAAIYGGYKIRRPRGSLGARFEASAGLQENAKRFKGKKGDLTVIRERIGHNPILVAMK